MRAVTCLLLNVLRRRLARTCWSGRKCASSSSPLRSASTPLLDLDGARAVVEHQRDVGGCGLTLRTWPTMVSCVQRRAVDMHVGVPVRLGPVEELFYRHGPQDSSPGLRLRGD